MSILQLTLKDLRQWLGAAIYSWWPMLLPTLFAAVVVACPAEADAAATHTATHAASHAAVASVTHAASQPADSDKVTQLDEVVIKRKRQKYSKKNNPAYDLMTRIRTAKELNDPLQDSLYSYDYYDKLLLGVNEYDIKAITKRNQYRFLEEYVDTAVSDHFPVMLLSVREKAGTRLYSQSPRYQKNIVTAVRSKGIDDLFDQKNINVIFDDLLRPIDIYDNDITLMSNRFVSPLSAIAGDVYKYFLNDTIHAPDGRRYLELVFTPRNPQSFGFNGRMFVEAGDSTYFVKAVRMRVPRVINLNYIDNIYISQDFERDSLGRRHLTSEEMSLELNLVSGTPTFFGKRTSRRRNFSRKPREGFDQFIASLGKDFTVPGADALPADSWSDLRQIPLSPVESSMGSMIQRLRRIPFFYWTEKVLHVLVQGYISTWNPSKVDIGPVNTMISYNAVEGVRLRLGGVTTASLSPHWFGRGYVAYGCRDRKFKYDAEVEYSFRPKQLHAREFPIHLLRGKYKYDIKMIGQKYQFTNPDNVFLSLKRKQSDLALYKREAALDYHLELLNNFSLQATFSHSRYEATPFAPFILADGTSRSHYNLAGLSLTLRYAPGEKFIEGRSMRMPTNMDAPIFMLTHEIAPRGFLGGDFMLNRTEVSIFKRFWLSAFGYIDAILRGGKIWSQVQYPELLWPNVNLSYTIQPEAFSLMNPMEFPLDYYGSLDVTYWMNGLIFNRIPLINKLKIREVVNFKMLMGGLTAKNDPLKQANLYRFPTEAGTQRLSTKPYMEISAGIDNILTILRVDYVWRLSYRDLPGISRGGVRVSLHFNF